MAQERDLEARLEKTEWTPDSVEELEARIADLERIAPVQAASYRERSHQRLAAHIEESIHRPRLQPEDVAQLEDLLARALDQRKPEAAAPLRQALNKRLRVWEPVFELAAPYTWLPDGLIPKRVRVEEGGLIISATVAPGRTTAPNPRGGGVFSVRIVCLGNVRAEVDFDDSWRSATELGLVLNAEEEQTDAVQPQPKVRRRATRSCREVPCSPPMAPPPGLCASTPRRPTQPGPPPQWHPAAEQGGAGFRPGCCTCRPAARAIACCSR